jgi:hypothetical protein
MLYSFSYWDRMTHLKITPYAIILLVSLYLNSVTSFLGLVTGCCISVIQKCVLVSWSTGTAAWGKYERDEKF